MASKTYTGRRKPRTVGEGRSWGSKPAARVSWSDEERQQWREGKRAEVDALLAGVVEMFESESFPAMVAETMIDARAMDAPSCQWSMLNQLLMLRAGTTAAAGFRQWKEHGRHVAKGAHAFRILRPVIVKKENAETGEDDSKCVGFQAVPVFRLQDTEGDSLESFEPADLPPLYEVARRIGCDVDYLPAHALADFRGFYSPGSRSIVLLTHDQRTFFHELAHATHDATLRRRGRDIATVATAEAEVIAETAAAALCSMYGYGGFLRHSRDYIAHYAEGTAPAKAVAHVLGEVQQVLELILSYADQPAAVAA